MNANQGNGMRISSESLEAILTAILAVQKYPLEKAWSLLPSLRLERLTEPDFVAKADIGDLIVRLTRAGYERGMLNEMMATRVQHLMVAAVSGSLDAYDDRLAKKDKQAAQELLCKVKGIGPRVADIAWTLLE
jgi:3-methyladenine DNA glycosylase/8-oxoguanine DNA glycosylase